MIPLVSGAPFRKSCGDARRSGSEAVYLKLQVCPTECLLSEMAKRQRFDEAF